jgi:uncharacterized membrane protein YkoI
VKVSIEQARAAALNAVPGTITDQELEKEGGSRLRYSFDIKRGVKTYEVAIDAQTGHLGRSLRSSRRAALCS